MKHLRYLLMAALVVIPLTACDEDEDTPVAPPVITGTITGSVTAEGNALDGVTVNLVGATTQTATTAGGTYTFSNVEAGSYGVSISVPANLDVVFPQTALTTTITTANETQTVDFAGSYIRTASVVGTVTAGGPLSGVSVNISGFDGVDATETTDLAGAFAFGGLRAGDYTVVITGFPADAIFASTSLDVSVSSGGTANASFAGALVELGSISGAVTVDGVPAVAVPVTLSGAADATTQTGAQGAYTFADLAPGNYTVTITPPAETTFDAVAQMEDLEAGENATLSFAGVGPAEPAEISIQSITTVVGGNVVPINPTAVMGQIEVSLNILRGDRDLDRVDVLIGDAVVASQTFLPPAPGGAEAVANDEVVVLNVVTNQLRMGDNTYVPTIYNGANFISAILYEVGGIPIPTLDVPVVMANPDMLMTSDGALIPGVTSRINAGGTPISSGGQSWDTGGFQYDGPIYISFSQTQQSARWADLSGTCGNGTAKAANGTPATGIILGNTWSCANSEGANAGPGLALPVSYSPGATVVGPDGTAVLLPTFWTILGAQFQLPDTQGVMEDRWFPIQLPGAAVPTTPSTWDVDNLGPVVFINGSSADDVPGPLSAAVNGIVAFNDTWDERWINADFDLVLGHTAGSGPDVITLTDGGVGPSVAPVDTETRAALLYDTGTGDCGAVITNAGLGVTVTDNGTDGHVICGYGMDRLGNGPQNEPVSFYFGKDVLAPQARIHGLTTAIPGLSGTNLPALFDAALSPNGVSATPNTTIYNIAAPYDTDLSWGVEAIDDKAGFHVNATTVATVEQGPVVHSISRYDGYSGAPEPDVAVGPDYMNITLSDNWNRSSTPAGAAAEVPLLAGLTDPGHYVYAAAITDMAGNVANLGPYNWIVDQVATGVMSALVLGQLTYTPGAGGLFNFYGSDDLEAISVQTSMVYPVDLANDGGPPDLLVVNYAEQPTDPLAANQRWDTDFTFDVLNPLPVTVSDLVPGVGVGIIGRIDFTTPTGAVPAAFNLIDGPDADLTPGDDDYLPISINGWIADDAGMNGISNIINTPFVPLDVGGWSAAVSEQWSTADIVDFTFFGADLDATPEDDTQFIAQHKATNSITEPYFTGVALVVRRGLTVTVCDFNAAPASFDQGFNRFYQYVFGNPSLLSLIHI